MTYEEFLETKEHTIEPSGFTVENLNKNLFDYQQVITKWTLRIGEAALFEDTELSKTTQQLSQADVVAKHTGDIVLILVSLAVSKQTAWGASKFGIIRNLAGGQGDIKPDINITNYKKIHKFGTGSFSSVVLDESSILKSYAGETTKDLQERFAYTSYKLCCTATPSPNDYTEIGATAEFLGVTPRSEMLATFFINDSIKKRGKNDRTGWRLKCHMEKEFFRWMATWSMMIKSPTDLGYDGEKFVLPKLHIKANILKSESNTKNLFVEYAETLQERGEARKQSLDERMEMAKSIARTEESCLIWCNYNNKSSALHKAIRESVEVRGSDTPEHKERAMMGFTSGDVRYFVTEPPICGFGMNWQNCRDMTFCGLSDSYEQSYQAIRRCYHFGRRHEINVHVIISEKETNVLDNIKREQTDREHMDAEMIKVTSESAKVELFGQRRKKTDYIPEISMEVPKQLPF